MWFSIYVGVNIAHYYCVLVEKLIIGFDLLYTY